MAQSFQKYALALAIVFTAGTCSALVYNPIDYGAVPNGTTISTSAIQQAIDAAAAAGGGTVQLTTGTYLSGTIFFKNDVTLQLDSGATLLGSTNLADYPQVIPAYPSLMYEKQQVTQSLIYAEGLHNIGITGAGTINGQGGSFTVPTSGPVLVGRPFLIRVSECNGVSVNGVTLRNSASWTQLYQASDNVSITGITVDGHAIRNNDGIDIDGCQGVYIANCTTNTDDDGLCFKGQGLRPTMNVVVENCTFNSYCNSLKFGTDSQGGFQNIQISNVALGKPPAGTPPRILGVPEGIAGLALEVVDGGIMDNVNIDGVTVTGTRAPIFIKLGDRGRHLADEPRLPPGELKNVTISNLTATGATIMGSPIVGLPDHPIENLTLRNISISSAGGGTEADTVRTFDEKAASYPEATMFAARLPASGLYLWHADGVTLDNVQCTTVLPDGRPAITLEDVANATIINTPGVTIIEPPPPPPPPPNALVSLYTFNESSGTVAANSVASARRHAVHNPSGRTASATCQRQGGQCPAIPVGFSNGEYWQCGEHHHQRLSELIDRRWNHGRQHFDLDQSGRLKHAVRDDLGR